jgi:hypothetical protein
MTGMGYLHDSKRRHLSNRTRARGANLYQHRPTSTLTSPRSLRCERVSQNSVVEQRGSLSQDPLGFTSRQFGATYTGLYVYVGNMPVGLSDASGLDFDECPKERIPKMPDACEKNKSKSTRVALCARGIRDKPIGCHLYIRIYCSPEPGNVIDDVHSFGGVEGAVCKKCKEKCMDGQLRMYSGPFIPNAQPLANPDFPKNEEPHKCRSFEIGRPPAKVFDCMREVGRRIRDCCIPYEWHAIGKPLAGCNSNCAAYWMAKLCFTPIIGEKKDIELPDGHPAGCLGWEKEMPECVGKIDEPEK